MHSSDDSAPKAAESLCHWSEGGYDNEFQVPFNWRVVGTSTDHLQPFADGSVWCSSQDKSHTWSRIFPLFHYKQKQQNKMESQLLLLHGSNPNLVPLLVKRSPLSSNRVNRNFPPFVKSSAIKPHSMYHPSLIESRPVNCSEKTMETSRWTREIPSFHQLHPVSGGDNGKSTVDPFSQSSHGVTFTIFARLPRKTSSSFSWPMFSLLGSDDWKVNM